MCAAAAGRPRLCPWLSWTRPLTYCTFSRNSADSCWFLGTDFPFPSHCQAPSFLLSGLHEASGAPAVHLTSSRGLAFELLPPTTCAWLQQETQDTCLCSPKCKQACAAGTMHRIPADGSVTRDPGHFLYLIASISHLGSIFSIYTHL